MFEVSASQIDFDVQSRCPAASADLNRPSAGGEPGEGCDIILCDILIKLGIHFPLCDVEFSKSRGSKASNYDAPLAALQSSGDVFVLVCSDSQFPCVSVTFSSFMQIGSSFPLSLLRPVFHKACFTSAEASSE